MNSAYPQNSFFLSWRTALAIALLCFAPASVTAQDSVVETLLRQAASLEARGRLDLAVQTWQRALLANPDQPDALIGLARNAKRRGDSAEAERLLARIRRIAPSRPEIDEIEGMRVIAGQEERLNEARRLAAAQDYDRAMQIYREVVGPSAPPGGIATAYYETEAATAGGWPRAVSGLRRLVGRFPQASAYKLSLGRLLTYRPETRLEGIQTLQEIANDPEASRDARAAWRQALVWEGPNPRAVSTLEAYLGGGADPEVTQILTDSRNAQAAQVDNGGAAEGRGYAALNQNRLEDAEAAFQQALRVAPRNAGAMSGLGFIRMKQQRFHDAEGYFARALELKPDDEVMQEAQSDAKFWSLIEDGGLADDQKKYDDAAAHYSEALKIRPEDVDAVKALAGIRMKQGRSAEAAPLFERVVASRPEDYESWKALLRNIYESDGAAATLARHRRMSEATALELENDVEHLILMASVYSKTGRQAQFDMAFQKVLRMTPNESSEMNPVRLQFAGLLNDMGRHLDAAAEYEHALQYDVDNIDAWEGLLAALMNENNGRAMAVLSRMPRDVYDRALERPSFLFNIGLLHRAAGHTDEASAVLRRALGMSDKLSRERLIAIKLQLAYIDGEADNWAEAERSLRRMVADYPQEPEAWKALISAMHEQGRDEEAQFEADRIPAIVITRLYNDPGYVGLMAAVHNSLGQYDDGLRLVRDAIAIFDVEQRPVPADLQIQLGWLLLNSVETRRETYELMQTVSARRDLTEKQRGEVNELWTVWSLRESNEAVKNGDFERAIAILSAAIKLFPEDSRLYAALGGALLDAGNTAQALLVYRSWDLVDGNPEDYAGAIGAAMSMNDQRSSVRWLGRGLQTWPRDPTLLTLAGQEAASRGDYRRAEEYWQLALKAMPESSDLMQQLAPEGGDSQTMDLGRLLLAGVVDPAEGSSYGPLPEAGDAGVGPPERRSAEPASSSLSDVLNPVRRRNANAAPAPVLPLPMPNRAGQVDFAQSNPTQAPVSLAAALPIGPGPAASAKTDRERLQDQIDALHARNSSFTGIQPTLRSRSGREGFETLSEQQLNFEAATVVGDKFRLAFLARPTFLDAGNLDGNSELRLGLAPAGADIGDGTASGIGAEAQLSSENFGLKAGLTPDGFLVRNATFGLRLRPAGGPFTLMLDRDVVKDTLLSYAGVADPISGQVFGGVMSNALSLQGDWSRGSSGVYARAGYQYITGKNVLTNRRIDGGGGAWWKLMSTPEGSLTLGANLFGMKYDKNLRYFTLGHGGYFSPQRYLLFNFPLTWQGVYNGRFDYTLSGGIGLQHIAEDDSAYFPLDAALQGRKGPVYQGLTQTGEHFSLRMEGGYRVAPHWTLGGFVDVNNTRSYTNQVGGFYLRYVHRAQPLVRETTAPSLPDWTGDRRLGLP